MRSELGYSLRWCIGLRSLERRRMVWYPSFGPLRFEKLESRVRACGSLFEMRQPWVLLVYPAASGALIHDG